jgi:hypothetical protein
MRWRKPPAARLGNAWVLALIMLCVAGGPLTSQASVLSPNPIWLTVDAVPLLQEVRRRFRRYRRFRNAPLGREQTISKAPDGGGPKIKDGQGPPPPPVSGKVASQAQKPNPPSAGEGKDRTPAKSPEPAGPPLPPDKWTAAEVQAGVLDCDRRLSSLRVLFDRLDPIKEGACGSPAPIRLRGFDTGQAPALAFSPAPTVSCKLTEALRRWFNDVVQPKAIAHFTAAIVRVTNLSAYNCRSRYADSTQRLSQHAYANAIDISEFITAKGERISVLDDWNSSGERSAFLHDIHDGACEIFGTTLGPEANEAHKNHFHLDMIDRQRPLCDFTPAQARAREEAKRHSAVPASAPGKGPVGSQSALKAPEKMMQPKPEAAPQKPKTEPKAVAAQQHRRHRRRFRRFARF